MRRRRRFSRTRTETFHTCRPGGPLPCSLQHDAETAISRRPGTGARQTNSVRLRGSVSYTPQASLPGRPARLRQLRHYSGRGAVRVVQVKTALLHIRGANVTTSYEMLPEFPLSQSQVAPGIQNNSESSPQQKFDVAGVSHAPERKPSTRRSSTPTSTRRLVRGPPQRPPRVARTPLTQRVGFCFGPAPFAVALFSLQLRTAPRVQCRSLIRQPTTTTANKQQHGVLVVVGTEHDEVAHEHVETARREVRVLVPHVEGPLGETSPAASFA